MRSYLQVNKKNAIESAERLLSRLGVISNNKVGKWPVDIEEIIEIQLNLQVIHVPGNQLKTPQGTARLAYNPECKSILVAQGFYDNPANEFLVRYGLAHELGHHLLHQDTVTSQLQFPLFDDGHGKLVRYSRQSSALELEACAFASNILLPRPVVVESIKNEVRKYYQRTKADKMYVNTKEAENAISEYRENLLNMLSVQGKVPSFAVQDVLVQYGAFESPPLNSMLTKID